MTDDRVALARRTAEIVGAFVSRNEIRAAELRDLISSTYTALQAAGCAPGGKVEPLPPVPVRKSITRHHLISLEDGKRYKSLKQHLAGRGLTPQQYREKWGLPSDYPMAAPNYAARRSELAKAFGLGRSVRPNDAKLPTEPLEAPTSLEGEPGTRPPSDLAGNQGASG